MDITKPQFITSNLQGGNPAIAQSIQNSSNPPQQAQQQTPQSQQPVQTITAKDGTVLDAGVVNLSKAIRQQESGGNYNAIGDNSTSTGAYQWQPGNFAKDAQQFGLNPNDFSPVNQDKVAYAQINAYKQAGYSPSQIASMWNSGKPDATGNVGVKTINGKPVNYDTPKYVQGVLNYFNQYKQQTPSQTQSAPQGQQPQEQSPSIGGFLGNVVQSGANLLGNIGNAALHPLQTIQNVGGAAVGGLQELGGQSNDNTAKFDNLVGYFKQRYGGVDNLLHTAYTDPVGLAGDIAAVFGVGEGALSAASKGAELAGAGARAIAGVGGADFLAGAEGAGGIAQATAGSGLAGGLQDASKIAGNISEATNPLTPLVKGAGALLDKTKDLSDIIANPKNYTPEDIANSSSEAISKDVQDAFEAKRADLSETGSGYTPFKENPVPITTTPDSLDNILRDTLKVDVKDGVISANSDSLLRNSTDISKLQGVYNTYKTDFLNDSMNSNRLLNLRSDLGKIAFNDLGIKNTDVAQLTAKVRGVLNDTYRQQVPGLQELDSQYESKINNLNDLQDGLVYKTGSSKGDLKTSFINKALKAAKTGDTETLNQLEEISPGITKRLQVNQAIKDLGNAYSPVSLVEKAGTAGALLTGNVKGAIAGIASIILSKPEIAVPLLKAIGANIDLVKGVMANLAKFTTLSVTGNSATQNPQGDNPYSLPNSEGQSITPPVQQLGSTDQQKVATPNPQSETNSLSQSSSSPNPTIDESKLQALAVDKNFDLERARKDGISDQDIYNYLNK